MPGEEQEVVPPFSLDADRWEDTFAGRLKHIVDVFDPFKLLLSDDEVDAFMQLLDDFKAGKRAPGVTDTQLWEARNVKEALIHPDTGEALPRLFSFAAYTPMQPPILVGLCWPNAGIATVLFWQWANQSFNTCVNYCNRNAAGGLDDQTLAMSYGVAVSMGCGLAVGMGKLSTKLKNPMVKLLAPFVSVAAAGCGSLVVIRHKELETGVPVYDHEKVERGYSVKAAQAGISACCVTRVAWNIPNLLVPPFIMAALEPVVFAANPILRLPFFTVLGTVCCFCGIYPAQALFSQNATITPADMEPEFHGLLDSQGRPVDTFRYNKGL